MKRSRIGILSLLLAAAMLLVGCGGDDKPLTDTATPSTNQETQSTDTGEPEVQREFIKIGNNSNLIVKLENTASRTYINDFMSSFEMKTGMTLRQTNAQAQSTDFEIIVGSVSGRQQSTEFFKEISYDRCTAEIRDGKLFVGTYMEDLLEGAFSAINRALVKENGEWGIWSDFSYDKSIANVSDKIPTFNSASGTMIEGVKSNDGFLTGYTGAAESEYDAYCKKLTDAGFTLHTSNTVKTNKYATYVTDETLVHVSWQGAISTFRVFVSPKSYVPAAEAPTYTKVAEPTVAQMMLTGGHGMMYVVRLEDGSFVVIDGGNNNATDKSTLINYLKANKPTSHSKPRVTWIITHPHQDHIALALSFLQSYSNQIQLDAVSFNFPEVDALSWSSDYTTAESKNYSEQKIQELWNTINEKYKDTDIFVHHTGQKLKLAGAEIEFVFTQEDWWPNACQTFNDTCSAFKITFANGKSFFVTADSDEGVCNLMAQNYGDFLKCDVFQAAHHGQKGGTASLYRLLKPTYVFWPNSEEKCTTTVGDIYQAPIHHSERASFNPILFNDTNIRGHFHASKTTVINMNTMTARDYATGSVATSFWPLS